MKKRILLLLATILAIATLICGFAFAAYAEEAKTPTVSIDKFNLVFEDNVYLKYAVKFEGVADSKINATNIGMLYFTAPMNDYTKGGEAYSSAVVGYQTIEGQKYYTFEYRHITAKQMTDYIYSVAYIDLDGERICSAPVKYSVLDYCYSKLGKTGTASTNADFRELLTATLQQGAAAQKYFGYNANRLANAEYYLVEVVGGTLEDGFTKGLYHDGETATLTAPETSGELVFLEWKNNQNKIVSTENLYKIRSFSTNQIYTVSYAQSGYSKNLFFTSNNNGTCYVDGIGSCKDTEIHIPPISPSGDTVTKIDDNAFDSKTQLRKIVIPNGVEIIGNYAFLSCSNLQEIVMPDTIRSIYNYAFSGCTNLVNINIPNNVSSIGNYAFYNCKSIVSITLPNSMTSIVNEVFRGCSKLEKVVIPESITSIGAHAFEDCTSLTDVTLSKNLTSLGSDAFSGCSSLTSIEIPQGVKRIGDYTFWGCAQLHSIIIPASVTQINSSAFSGCSKLSTVYYTGNEAKWAEIRISDGNYALIESTRYYYSEMSPATEGNFWHYNENGEIEIWA